MRRTLRLFFLLFQHSVSVFAIFYFLIPIARWYFQNPVLPESTLYTIAKPLWGIDFYYTANLVETLSKNIKLPPAGWGYAWFSGWPIFSNYPVLHYYLILPLLNYFSLIDAVKVWMIFGIGAFAIGSYLCFYVLSRNIFISSVLAIGGLFSVGFYGSLMWGGSLPNHATQAFLPWVLLFVIRYLQGGSTKNLLIATLLSGLAVWGHPQIAIAYIYPYAFIIFLFSVKNKDFITRIKAFMFLSLTSLLISAPIVLSSAGGFLKTLIVTNSFEVATSTANVSSQATKDIILFHRAQPFRIISDTSNSLFITLSISFIVFIVGIIFTKSTKALLKPLPFIILAVFGVFYIVLFSYGISIYHGGWYRLFWVVPIWLGLLASSLWGVFEDGLQKVLGKYFLVISISIGALVSSVGISALLSEQGSLTERIIARSNPSSAYPDILNLKTSASEMIDLKKKLVPEWIDTEDRNFRLYSADQTVNIWWNALFNMPLARGYFDLPSETGRGYTFWVDAALNVDNTTGKDQLVSSFEYPQEVAFNNTLFLLDWYSIKFLEAGHASPATTAPLPKRLQDKAYIEREEIISFNDERYNRGNQTLNYYQIKSVLTNPILSATNASVIGIFASDQGYETIVRALADANLNSKYLIPVRVGRSLDSLSSEDLSTFDALILYDYKYKNQGESFKKISKFLQKGGNVFIDTGVDGPESESISLPEIFPIDETIRKDISNTWDFEITPGDLTSGIDFFQFAPPKFDKFPWKFSYPKNPGNLREGSQVILKNHGREILVRNKIGNGTVIWSGMNLPYHVTRNHVSDEVKFFQNIISTVVDLTPKESPKYTVKFISSTKRVLETQSSRGILFREQNFPGWNAKLTWSGGSKVSKIWPAGPAYPGFMYIAIPQNAENEKVSVTLDFRGSMQSWILFTISFLISLFIVEYTLLGGAVLGRLSKFIWSIGHSKLSSWWGKDE